MTRNIMGLAAAGILVVSTAASAAVDAENGFDPATASPGDQVTFFSSAENTGDEPTTVTLEMTITFDFGFDEPFVIGPFGGDFDLAAGEARSLEIPFMIPPMTPAGYLTIDLVASDADGSDAASATLEIVDGARDGSDADLQAEIRAAFDDAGLSGDGETLIETNWSGVKEEYR